ncbi:MAG: hypothetical protein RML72_02425 [Bacteroidia bacterium]|nr:hypothetical protein [Bacteroidia bacterium]MDW8157716.1 hypothetical protein [Bacteroidia bacterium]
MAKSSKKKIANRERILQKLIHEGSMWLKNGESKQSEAEIFAERLNYVLNIVSLWSHACMIDGELALSEEMSVSQLINYFFGGEESIFPAGKIDVDVVFGEITETFLIPRPLDEVIDFAKENEELAAIFYEQACCIVASDGKLRKEEREFLNRLSQKLNLPPARQHFIENKYIQNLI